MSAGKMGAFIREHGPQLPAAASWQAQPMAQHFAKDADADDDDDDDDDPDDDDPDDDDADDDGEKSEEELRAELAQIRRSLKTANGQSAKRRKKAKALEAELEAERQKKAKSKKAGADDDDAPDLDEIREAARRDGEKAGIERAKRSEARAALASAGVPRDRVARAVGLLDLDDLDLDDDGLDGIDDQIEKLREDMPELFPRKTRERERRPGARDRIGGRDDDGKRKPKSASEKAAAQLLGRG